VSLTYKRTYQR